MPKKILHRAAVPTLVQDRLTAWGKAIRKQRTVQHMRATDLCSRMEISEATLYRLEKGDAGAGAALYLMAFQILGLLDEVAPSPPASLWDLPTKQRVRLPSKETGDDYF